MMAKLTVEQILFKAAIHAEKGDASPSSQLYRARLRLKEHRLYAITGIGPTTDDRRPTV